MESILFINPKTLGVLRILKASNKENKNKIEVKVPKTTSF
jgi:hypothetical protein